MFLQRDLEADVAHDGGDDRVARQPALPLAVQPEHQQHGIAVDDVPEMVHKNRAIAVAVERDAQPAPVPTTTRPASCAGCVDPHARLMLRPSGASPTRHDVEAERRNSGTAVVVVAPLAMSTPMRAPASAPADGSRRRR